MNTSDSLFENIQSNLGRSLPLIALIATVTAALLFVALTIVPQWQTHSALASQIDTTTTDDTGGRSAADYLEEQIASLQTQLSTDMAANFLSDDEVEEISARLYDYANVNGVKIMDLQQSTTSAVADDSAATQAVPAYEVKTLQLRAVGSTPDLMGFVSSIREAAIPAVTLANLNIAQEDDRNVLTMNLVLYTSAYASGNLVGELPAISQQAAITVESPLQVDSPDPDALGSPSTATTEEMGDQAAELQVQWAAENWEESIRILEAMMAAVPDDLTYRQQLYTAHINYSYQLVAEGRNSEAEAELERAFELVDSTNATSSPDTSTWTVDDPVCDCSANLYDCRDFSSQSEAQSCYEYCGGRVNDVHRLDGDLNGAACESLWP